MSELKRVFSGVQPTGDLHIGNYIGAISLWRDNQDKYHNIYCVVDLHAITIPERINAADLQKSVRDTIALYIACGIDPAKSIIFVQSQVRQHSELAWILNCVTPMGWMNRMTQFKSKSEGLDSVGIGLYDYPVLQAADILLYQTHLVPVGEDQRQHIEITRDIAERFHHLFDEVFVLPEMMSRSHGAKIAALDDPTQKMSKSTDKKGHAIRLLDDPKTLKKTIMSAVTDSKSGVDFDDMSDGVSNLINIIRVLDNRSDEELRNKLEGQNYGTLKREVLDVVMATLEPIQKKFHEIRGDEAALDQLANEGAEKARAIAEETMQSVRQSIGLF